jgi:hypothetical protein
MSWEQLVVGSTSEAVSLVLLVLCASTYMKYSEQASP